ncbi:MAG: VWA domain-containing protein [Candidatus Dormibacteria bacterium]
MTFTRPLILLAVVLVGLLGILYIAAQGRRREYTLRFTNLDLLESVAGRRPGRRRHLPPILLLTGMAFLVIGIAGPILNLEVPRHDASVMLVIDVSGSMLATDVKPTRLDAARSAAISLIDHLPGTSRVGLVSFNGRATLAAALTDDRGAVKAALNGLRADGATAVGDALSLAISQLNPTTPLVAGSRPAAMVVLLTDGVSNRGTDPLGAAEAASASRIPVQTIGIGSRDGLAAVHGQSVGGVDESTLGAIAKATGGKYFFAEGSGQLSNIYSALGAQFGWRFLRLDITVPLMILGMAAMLGAATLSLGWFRVLP